MGKTASDEFWSLTEKEKQTLRLIVRGHDAKSMARDLGLSVHTINERLRDARRKMAVSSSREAARILLDAEGGEVIAPVPHSLGDSPIGEDATPVAEDQGPALLGSVGQADRRSWIIIGVLVMTLTLGLLMLAALPQAQPLSQSPPMPASSSSPTMADAEVADVARQWLALLDQARWDDSYRATGKSFRDLNTAQAWAAASEKARTPLGHVISRTLVSQENLPAPPHGYEVARFRSRFTNRTEAIETVTLDREDGNWRVVGVTID